MDGIIKWMDLKIEGRHFYGQNTSNAGWIKNGGRSKMFEGSKIPPDQKWRDQKSEGIIR